MIFYRVFLFQEGDKGSKDSAASKGLAKIFSRGRLSELIPVHLTLKIGFQIVQLLKGSPLACNVLFTKLVSW